MNTAARTIQRNAYKRTWRKGYLARESAEQRSARRAKKKAAQKAYYWRNRDLILARQRERSRRFRESNPQLAQEQNARRRKTDPERRRKAYRQRQSALSPEQRALERSKKGQRDAVWRKGSEHYRLWRKDYRRKNAARERQAYQDWYDRNRAEILARKRLKYQQDRDRMRARGRIQRGRRRKWITSSPAHYTLVEWQRLVEVWNNCCAYCGARPEQLHADHRTPVSRGGSNAIDNIHPACPSCNFRKHTMTEDEFRARLASDQRRLGEPWWLYRAAERVA